MVHLHAVEDVAVLEDLEGLVGADVVGLDYSIPVPHHHLVVVHLQTPHRVVAICGEPPAQGKPAFVTFSWASLVVLGWGGGKE